MSHDPTRAPDGPEPELQSAERPDWLRGAVGSRGDVAETALLTGHLEGIDDEGRLLFRAEGEPGVIPVIIGMEASDGVLVRAARRKQRALVMRTADATARWVLVGLVRDRVALAARDAKPGRLQVKVDGEKLTLEAEHDLELRCGQSAIVLRYDGRVEIRGTHIVSASRGPNRVKGATIELN